MSAHQAAAPRTTRSDTVEIAPVGPGANGDGFWWDELSVAGQTVGTVVFSLSADGQEMVLDKLYVLEAHRRQGHGGRLIEHVCEQARAAGCSRITLTVSMNNANAIRAYLKNGFDVQSTFLGDHLIMVRDLSFTK